MNNKAPHPTLGFYNACSKGCGSALRLSVYPATCDDDGHILAEFANQITGGKDPALYRFDWESPIVVKLRFDDLSQMLQVLRGETESIKEGHGLVHKSASDTKIIKFSHEIVNKPGYYLAVDTAKNDGSDERHVSIFLPSSAALGLTCSIENVMHLIAFGY